MVLFWTVVPPSEAHYVVWSSGKTVVCPDEKIGERKAYFAWPAGIPWLGRRVRIIPLTIQEIGVQQETYEKGQARYHISTSVKYRVTDVKRAAETITTIDELNNQLVEIIKSATRAVTAKYDVTEARAQKQTMQVEIQREITDDFSAWGLTLVNFQLVDFLDTLDSKIISNISKRREVEIETTTREQNADKFKQARLKEAEAEELARTREISKDKVVAEREQNKLKDIAIQAQVTKEKEYEVVRTQTIKQAEINRDKAAVEAEQAKKVAIIDAERQKEVTEINRQMADINKDKMELEGIGIRLKAEQEAKAIASPILEKGLAEAKAKDALQNSLNKFTPAAITALTAEMVVNMQRDVGLETAKALSNAELKIFSGGDKSQQGFDLSQLITSAQFSNDLAAKALLNRLGVPNDLGFGKKSE